MLDARLTEIWAELFQVPRERWDHELIGWFLRAAYGQGYCDALREPAGGFAHARARVRVPRYVTLRARRRKAPRVC